MVKKITVLLAAVFCVGIALVLLAAVVQHDQTTIQGAITIKTRSHTAITSSRSETEVPVNSELITATPSLSRTPMASLKEIQLLSPLEGSIKSGNSIFLKWTPITNAQEYRIEIQMMPKGIVVERDVVPVPYVFIWWLPSDGEYRWRVTALNRDSESISISEWQTFTYETPKSTQISP